MEAYRMRNNESDTRGPRQLLGMGPEGALYRDPHALINATGDAQKAF